MKQKDVIILVIVLAFLGLLFFFAWRSGSSVNNTAIVGGGLGGLGDLVNEFMGDNAGKLVPSSSAEVKAKGDLTGRTVYVGGGGGKPVQIQLP